MKIVAPLLLLFVVGCSACNVNKKSPEKNVPAVIFKIEVGEDRIDSNGNEALAIRFYENGTYSHFGYNFFAYGNWSWNVEKKRAILKPRLDKYANAEQQYKILYHQNNDYTIKKVIEKNGKVLVENNDNQAFGFMQLNEPDPFSEQMNTWRIKPQSSESKETIKKRVLNYLQFLVTYNQFIIENKLNFYTYAWFPTPIQMHYANGVRMAYSDELNDWNACFYNITEATEAYKLLSGNIRKCKVKNINSKPERNIDYLKQLILAINKM